MVLQCTLCKGVQCQVYFRVHGVLYNVHLMTIHKHSILYDYYQADLDAVIFLNIPVKDKEDKV